MAIPDHDACYRAVLARDARFDGWFVTAVRSTGVYCRPSCPARTPIERNVRFFASAAAAQRSGYRACKRCRPDASPGSPDWDARGDLVGRALRLIADGVVDREGVPGLARRVGYSERQLNRALTAEVGAGPLALARTQRARTARILLETTALPATDVAFAAGFASVRQFNDTVRHVFAATPTELRRSAHTATDTSGAMTLRLAYRAPMDLHAVLGYLGARAVDGLEVARRGSYARAFHAPHGPVAVTITAHPHALSCTVDLRDHRDLVSVVARVRRLLDLDADPVAIDEALSANSSLAPLVTARPGLRSPGSVDGFELAVRALVGQQISVAAARTVLGRIAHEYGTAVTLGGRSWQLFPTAKQLAAAHPDALPMPRARGRTVVALAQAVDAGEIALDAGADRDETAAALQRIAGIGPWTARYVRMRALADPDVLLTGDLGVERSAAALGIALAGGRPDWAPWRSYVTHHLWAAEHATEQPA